MASLNDILKSILSSGNDLSKEVADKHRRDMDYAPRSEGIPASIARPLEISPELNDAIMQGVGDPKNLPTPPQKLQGLAPEFNMGAFMVNPAQAMQDKVLTQGDGSSIPMALSRSMTPIADAYPSLNAAIMKRVGDPTNIPSAPSKPQKSESLNMIEDAGIKPTPKEEVSEVKVPKQASTKKEKPEAVDSEEVTTQAEPEKKPRTFDTEEARIRDLAEKYMVARRNANMYAGNMQSNDTLAFMTGRPAGNEGLALKYKNELGKAEDAKAVLDERRLEQKHSLDVEKAVGQLDDEKATRDANSDISTSARDILKAMSAESGIKLNIPDNMPYSHLKEMFKPLESFMQARANQETRKEAAATRALTMQMMQKEKEDSKVDDKFNKVSKMMVEDLASSRTVFGKNANIIRSADAIDQLVAGKPLGDVNPQQFYEMAKSLDAMLSMGASTITGTQKLMPRTALQDFASFKQYLSGKPQGMQTPEFVKSYMDTVKRERDLAKNKIMNAKESMLFPVLQYKDTHPEKMEQLLRSTGLPLDILEKSSGKKQEAKEEKAPEKASSETVTLRSKVTGSTLTVSRDKAKKFLEDPNIEEVK